MEPLLLSFFSLASGGAVLFFLKRLDRHRLDQAGGIFVFLFPLVGALSVFPGLLLYSWAEFLVPSGTSRWSQVLFIWTINAPVEELAKYFSFVLATQLLKSLKEPQDGVLQGAATGLGFGLVENYLYGLSGGWELLALRALVSLPGHVIYGAVWGGYHGFEVYQGRGAIHRWWIPLLALIPAAFAHAVFNTLAFLGTSLAVTLIVDIFALVLGAFLFLRLRDSSPSNLRRPLRLWRQAIPELEHALALNPDSDSLRQRLAAYFLVSNQPDRALAVLEPSKESPWTTFYRDAAKFRLEPQKTLPPSSSLDPKLFQVLSGA